MRNGTKYLLTVLLDKGSLTVLTVIYHFLVTNFYGIIYGQLYVTINSWDLVPKEFGYRYLSLTATPSQC